MPAFGLESMKELQTCHPSIQKVLFEAVKHFDFKVLQGHRTPEQQAQYLKDKTSWTLNSLHLKTPSMAVDIAPYPIDWKNAERFLYLAGMVMGIAGSMGIAMRYGGDWDHDEIPMERNETDLGHFELL